METGSSRTRTLQPGNCGLIFNFEINKHKHVNNEVISIHAAGCMVHNRLVPIIPRAAFEDYRRERLWVLGIWKIYSRLPLVNGTNPIQEALI